MIHPPTHLHYFSAKTISRLLDRLGVDVVSISHPGVSRRLHMILFGVLSMGLKKSTLIRAIEHLPLPDLHLVLNLFDIMFVVARKRG